MTANLVPDRDRAVSVTALTGALTPERVRQHLLGREAYRRSRYAVVWAGDETAVARLTLADTDSLMSAIVEVEVLAGPDETVWLEAGDVDTGVPAQLVAVARARAPGARCVVVRGRYAHISFVLDPEPVRVRVIDVIPPEPAKLWDQAQRIIDVDEDLPPIELVADFVDVRREAAAHPRASYLLPCRGGGELPGDTAVAYLDERPPRREWTLIGCQRSCELHAWFYGDLPEVIDFCPRLRPPGDQPTLAKCCQIEHGVDYDPDTRTVVVPWGATLAEVRAGLQQLVDAREPTWALA